MQRFSLPTLVALAWTVLLGLGLALGIPFGVLGEWVWSGRQIFPFAFPSLLLTFASLAFLFALAARFSPSIGGCFALFVVAVFFRFSFAMLTPMQPTSAFWALAIASPITTTFFTEARQVEREGLSHYLRHYHETLAQKPFHAATHPPGLPLTFVALRAIARHPLLQRWTPLDDATLAGIRQLWRKVLPLPDPKQDTQILADWELKAAWWGAFLCVLAGCLAFILWGWLLWQFASDEFKSVAVVLAATTPATLWWQPTVDSLHWFLIIATMAGAVRWQRRPCWTWATVTGLLGGLASWIAFKNAFPLAALFLWLLWSALTSSVNSPATQFSDGQISKSAGRQMVIGVPLAHWLWMFVLLTAPFLFAWLLFGFQPIATLLAANAAHHAQAGAHARSYLLWLFVNPLDFAMGLGGAWLGLTIAFLLHWWRTQRFRPSLTLCTLIVLSLLNISGIVRGEVARLWMPFIPLLTLETVTIADKALTGRPKFAALLPAALQGIMAIALHLRLEFLRPW
ncbi:MAG: hypothetical protein KEFWMYNX_000542 [Candidatus Fervidibacter sp.]